VIMRAPCVKCGHTEGHIETRNGQDVVRCAACDRYQYCAPRTETGREARNHRTRPDIKPSQRARVLDRDGGRCIICHATERALDVGHLVSVDDGRNLGMTETEIFSDDNLAAMCAPCNSGYGTLSINPRIIVAAINARAKRRHGGAA
jgi:5-methylcytosine-specific restriction endonuclease McrA